MEDMWSLPQAHPETSLHDTMYLQTLRARMFSKQKSPNLSALSSLTEKNGIMPLVGPSNEIYILSEEMFRFRVSAGQWFCND